MTELQLRAPANRVSPRAVAYWTVRAAVAWAAACVVELIVWASRDDPSGLHLQLLLATATAAVVHLIVMPQWRYRVHRWEATDNAVYTQSGWFNQERRIAPVARIQTVDTHRGPLEQLFGLANVTVTTASAAGPLKIHGLNRWVAERLVAELTARTQRFRDDAT